MKRASLIILAVLTVCLCASADPGPATTDASTQVQDFVRFGRQDMAHGLATSALYYFGEAIKLQPNSADAWVGKARALESLKRWDEARTVAEKAVQLAPMDRIPWAIQGKVLFDQKHFNEALESLNKSLTLGNADTMVWRWKGQTLDSLNRHDEALNAYSKASPPEPPYHGGITRLTSGGPAHASGGSVKVNSGYPENDGEDSTEGRGEGNPPAQPQGSPSGFEYSPDYNPSGSSDGQSFGNPIASYYEDTALGGYGYGGTGGHAKRRAYSGYYNNGYADGGSESNGPVAVAPRTVEPYRGVEPLYQQGVVPQYFQSVTPPTDFRTSTDYRSSDGTPFISDWYYNGTNGANVGDNFSYYRSHRAPRGGIGGGGRFYRGRGRHR